MIIEISGRFEVDEERDVVRLILEWPFLPTMNYLPTELKILKAENYMDNELEAIIREKRERAERKDWYEKNWGLRPRAANVAALTKPDRFFDMDEVELEEFLNIPMVGPATKREIKEAIDRQRALESK